MSRKNRIRRQQAAAARSQAGRGTTPGIGSVAQYASVSPVGYVPGISIPVALPKRRVPDPIMTSVCETLAALHGVPVAQVNGDTVVGEAFWEDLWTSLVCSHGIYISNLSDDGGRLSNMTVNGVCEEVRRLKALQRR